jgi:hypothetical protein
MRCEFLDAEKMRILSVCGWFSLEPEPFASMTVAMLVEEIATI